MSKVKDFWSYVAVHPDASEEDLQARFGGTLQTIRHNRTAYEALLAKSQGKPTRERYGYDVKPATVERLWGEFSEWLSSREPSEESRKNPGRHVMVLPPTTSARYAHLLALAGAAHQ